MGDRAPGERNIEEGREKEGRGMGTGEERWGGDSCGGELQVRSQEGVRDSGIF